MKPQTIIILIACTAGVIILGLMFLADFGVISQAAQNIIYGIIAFVVVIGYIVIRRKTKSN